MKQEIFTFHVRNLSYGRCSISIHLNDKEINFKAGYLGPNPLSSLIDACLVMIVNAENNRFDAYHITWQAESRKLKIKLHLDDYNRLYLDLKEQDEYGKNIYGEWHEEVPFNDFLSAIVSEGFRVLNALGLYGYRCAWSEHSDFPLSNLLRITDKIKGNPIGNSYNSDISKEIECFHEYIEKLKITKEKRMEKCSIFYESWQMQCCGNAFAIGDKVEWTCSMPKEYKNAHGIILDFEEDHHGFATHSIIGTITKILAERSEFPKGQREVWYNKAKTIKEELNHADGWESNIKDDDITERTFWGYIVELKDVIIKPLEKE